MKCRGCENDVAPAKSRPQGGGTSKLYCSKRCAARTWARENTSKVAKAKSDYAETPASQRRKAAREQWRRNQPGFRLAQRLKQYGLTPVDFRMMLDRQRFKCLGCKHSISENGDEASRKAVVDHCHETERVRGLLCDRCNTVLGLLNEDKGTLTRLRAYLSYDRTKNHIYLVGALKNQEIPKIAKRLTQEGFEVFAEWHNPGPEADMFWQEHEKFKGSTYKEALAGSHVENVFYYDQAYIDLADIVVLVMPAGKSGHLELGYAAGSGKKTFILLDQEPDRYDVMPRFANAVCNNLDELIKELKGVETFLFA